MDTYSKQFAVVASFGDVVEVQGVFDDMGAARHFLLAYVPAQRDVPYSRVVVVLEGDDVIRLEATASDGQGDVKLWIDAV